MSYTVREVVWLQCLLEDLGVQLPLPIDLYCDNKAANHISQNPVFHERTKHIETDCHFGRAKI